MFYITVLLYPFTLVCNYDDTMTIKWIFSAICFFSLKKNKLDVEVLTLVSICIVTTCIVFYYIIAIIYVTSPLLMPIHTGY